MGEVVRRGFSGWHECGAFNLPGLNMISLLVNYGTVRPWLLVGMVVLLLPAFAEK